MLSLKNCFMIISPLLTTRSVVSAQSVQFQFGTRQYRYEDGLASSCRRQAR